MVDNCLTIRSKVSIFRNSVGMVFFAFLNITYTNAYVNTQYIATHQCIILPFRLGCLNVALSFPIN